MLAQETANRWVTEYELAPGIFALINEFKSNVEFEVRLRL